MASRDASFRSGAPRARDLGVVARGVAGTDGIVDLLRGHAAARPGALALGAQGRGLTYGELEIKSSELAKQLLLKGVGPEVLVGVCIPSSPDMVVAALAVLKAGGAYLPLDPSHPAERLSTILEDARPLLVIVPEGASLPEGTWSVLALSRSELEPNGGDAALPTSLSPQSLSYVVYTSGSTGEPKGVEITHASLSNLVAWHRRAFAVGPTDRAAQIASPAFDASVWEVWPYLASGASVLFPEEGARRDPERLRAWLLAEGVTMAFVPAPMAERLVALPFPRGCALRMLLTGADRLHSFAPPGLPFTLVNNYGPTECTVVATSGPVAPEGRSEGLPPIGRPIDNVRVVLRDDRGEPVPEGGIGELYIGGAGVARGYRNDPALTARRFIAAPASVGGRFFKTGDLAQRLPDGQLAFLGRVDEQVKLRGFRIEPAEVVAALKQYAGVAEAAVVLQGSDGAEARLVAYVVPREGARPAEGALRLFLRERLPEYMVPASFRALGALPLNTSGKVDRAALARPGQGEPLDREAAQAPRTAIEERVSAILAPLLGVEELSIFDNFFMVGGHSLLGTQLIARLREVYAIDLPLRALFEAPTVAGLSAEIERALLRKLEDVTDEEAEKLLRASVGAPSEPC